MALPAYDQCIKASHVFNLLDARGVISVTERQSYILRVRELAKACGEAWLATEGGRGWHRLRNPPLEGEVSLAQRAGWGRVRVVRQSIAIDRCNARDRASRFAQTLTDAEKRSLAASSRTCEKDGTHFRRQQPIGGYCRRFCVPWPHSLAHRSRRLAAWRSSRLKRDEARTRWLETEGLPGHPLLEQRSLSEYAKVYWTLSTRRLYGSRDNEPRPNTTRNRPEAPHPGALRAPTLPLQGAVRDRPMPDLLLELFSEEIPARMQARAAEDLKKLVTGRLVEAGWSTKAPRLS